MCFRPAVDVSNSYFASSNCMYNIRFIDRCCYNIAKMFEMPRSSVLHINSSTAFTMGTLMGTALTLWLVNMSVSSYFHQTLPCSLHDSTLFQIRSLAIGDVIQGGVVDKSWSGDVAHPAASVKGNTPTRLPDRCECQCKTKKTNTRTFVGNGITDEAESSLTVLRSLKVEEYTLSDEPWEFLKGRNVYNGLTTKPSYALTDHEALNEELATIRSEIASAASKHFKKNMTLLSVSDSYFRKNSAQGSEYIYDVQLKDATSTLPVINARVEVRQLYRPDLGFTFTNYNDEKTKTINFIVPIKDVGNRLEIFMQTYRQEFLEKNEKVRLILVAYGVRSVAYARRLRQITLTSNPSAVIVILPQARNTFSRGKALNAGIAILKGSELAFFCDVDLKIDHAFAQRCRRNTIRGKRAYFPEVFKMYNLDYVYRQGTKPSNPFIATRSHGHWGSYGFGMVCIYKSDYLHVGGFNTSITGWGSEDVELFKQVRRKLHSMQAPDTALWHQWHPKECSQTLSSEQYISCLGSKYETLADRKELAGLIYEQKLNMTA